MRSRWTLATVCFVVLPCLPALALVLLGSRSIAVLRDTIVVIVLAALVGTVASAGLALRAGRPRRAAGLYGLATAALSAVGVWAAIVVILIAFPSED